MTILRNGYKVLLNHEGINNGVVLALTVGTKNEYVTWITVNNEMDNTAHGNYFMIDLKGMDVEVAHETAYKLAFEDYLNRIKISYDKNGIV